VVLAGAGTAPISAIDKHRPIPTASLIDRRGKIKDRFKHRALAEIQDS